MNLRKSPNEILRKDNISEVQDLYELVQKTETYRAKKVADLRREHTLIMNRIDRVTQQRAAYINDVGILPDSVDMQDTMPVIKNDSFDTGESELSSNSETSKVLLTRRPTETFLNLSRDKLRENIPEINIKLRDYNYQLLKLSWMEKKIMYTITNLLKNETSVQQVSA